MPCAVFAWEAILCIFRDIVYTGSSSSRNNGQGGIAWNLFTMKAILEDLQQRVFFTWNRFLPTRHSAHPISVLILRPREIQALRSQNYDTKMLHHNAVKGVDDALPCHRTGIDRHNIRKLATQINWKKKNKNAARRKKISTPEYQVYNNVHYRVLARTCKVFTFARIIH